MGMNIDSPLLVQIFFIIISLKANRVDPDEMPMRLNRLSKNAFSGFQVN